MIQLNRIVESAILSALDLNPNEVKPCGVVFMIDNGCPRVILYYKGEELPADRKYRYDKMATIDGMNAICVSVDIIGSTYNEIKNYISYI